MATHYNEPINKSKILSGYGRKGHEVPSEVQQKVVDIIIEEGRKRGLDNRDLAYFIAIAKCESGFNPDAANPAGTASGIAQVIDDTAATYHIDSTNRFDARSSIKAGISYFVDLKKNTVKDYGTATGKYEPLVYFRYHFGEFSTRNRKVIDILSGKRVYKKEVWEPKPLEELMTSSKYKIAANVVEDAVRIEKILNDTHGLQIQLTDIMGIPLHNRKAILVKKVLKAAPAPAEKPAVQPAAAPATAPASYKRGPTSGGASNPADPNVPAPGAASVVGDTHVDEVSSAPNASEIKKVDTDGLAAVSDQPESTAANATSEHQPETGSDSHWDLVAHEVETDEYGNLPEFNSPNQQCFLVLIPRIDYEEYNDAVEKKVIPETGNVHQITPNESAPSDFEAIKSPPDITVDSVPPVPPKIEPKIPAPPVPAKKEAAVKPPGVTKPSVLDAAASKNQQPQQHPSKGTDITFNDVVMALKKDLGWKNVYETSFAYIKQFQTKPRLPAAPLDPAQKTRPGPVRTQQISSSLKNSEIQSKKTKDVVKTAPTTAVKEVVVTGDAPWMAYALSEQSKHVTENPASHENDKEWQGKARARDAANKEIIRIKKEIRKATAAKTKDQGTVSTLQESLKVQQKISDDNDNEMLEIEKKYNNPEILKYLHSTTVSQSLARNDDTAWCSSFTNWCIEQAGYKGTKNALAESWKDWGDEISEPRYGAITVVTRAKTKKGFLYHVGFFLGIIEKNVNDGFEEIEKNDKKGNIYKVKKAKFRKVKYVKLLSGNFSNTIIEFAEWTLSADDSVKHLVSYRWPNAKK